MNEAEPGPAMSPRFTEAFTWAASLHRDQVRKGSPVPYISHLMTVSALVMEDGGSEDEAIAGLLHDAAEDQGAEILLYIRSVFGDTVATIVEGCSDDLPMAGAKKRPWLERKSQYFEHLAEADTPVLRVSAADKLHNARATAADLQRTGWPESKACKHRNLWYYNTLRTLLAARLPDSRTAKELSRVVDELFEAEPTVDPATTGGPLPPSCGCAQPDDPTNDLAEGEIDPYGGPTDYIDYDAMSQEEVHTIVAADMAHKAAIKVVHDGPIPVWQPHD